MQNQNAQSWSWPQGAAASSSYSQSSSTFPNQFPPSGIDPSTLLTNYQQLYGAAAAATAQGGADYDPSQWTAAQMAQWQQWQQWQEKFQEWQTQYGKKYAETMAAMGQSPNITTPGMTPSLNPVQKIPGLISNPGYTTANPPLPPTTQPVPPPPPEEEKPPPPNALSSKAPEVAKNEVKDNPEELSEAEKTFDEQFKQWEGQFNAWKKQNQDHPDKTQYREYEKKWEQWREQLLQRREQMRKKRLSKTLNASVIEPETAAPTKVEEVKDKLPADQGIVQSKPLDSEYSYSTQGSQPSQMPPYTNTPHKFDMSKPPPFGNQAGNQNSFIPGNADGQRNHDNFLNQRPPSLLSQDGPKFGDFNRPPGNFGNWGKDNMEFNRPGPFNKFQDSQNFNRDPGFFGKLSPNFEGSKERNFNQGPHDGNFNKKFRGQNFDNRNFGSDADQGRFGGPNFNRNNDFPSNRFRDDNFDDNSTDNFNRGPFPKFGGSSRELGDNDNGQNFERSPFGNLGPRGKFDTQGPNSRFNDQNFKQGPSEERNFNSEMKSLFDSPVNPPGARSSLLGNPPGPMSLLGNPPRAPLLNKPPGPPLLKNPSGPPSLLSNPSGPPSLLNNPSGPPSLLNNPSGPSSLLNNPSSSLLDNTPAKSKVPSLFDITFDKPPALMPENNEKKPWEKYEKDDYFDDPFEDKEEKEEEEEDNGPWANNSSNNFNMNKGKFGSPWAKPWEMDRGNADKNIGPRSNPWQKGPKSGPWEEGPRQGPWGQEKRSAWQDDQHNERGPFQNASPWASDNNESRDMEKAELSGYVGNILAKLGNINADNMPPNVTGRNEEFSQDNSRRPNFSNRGEVNDGNRFRNDMKGNNFGRGNNRNERNFNKRFFNESDSGQNAPQSRENFQDTSSPRDNFRQIQPNRNFRNQNLGGPKQGPGNLDQFDETSRNSGSGEKISTGNFGGPSNRNCGTDFTDDVNLSDENFHTQNQEKFPQAKLDENELFNTGDDVDDRNQFGQTKFDKNDGNLQEKNDRNLTGKDNQEPFIREDSRGSFGKEEQRDLGNNERDSGDRNFGRENRNFRGGRNRGRRGFPRDEHDDRTVRAYDWDDRDRRTLGPYDRYSRGREYLLEPEWNPQVFDYSSQTRPNRYLNPEDIFKFSTVVDYSHGQPENKQTFDYGHGGKGTDKTEDKTFDYKYSTEAPEVIDYGHGSVNKELPDWKKEKEELEIVSEAKIEPKVVEPIREKSRSRSPPPPPFRRSSRSPPFRGRRSRSRDRFGRPIPKRNCRKEDVTETKLQSADKENSKNSFDVTTVLVEDLIYTPGRTTRPNKLVFIMRGLPGSGKTYVTKLIKDKEIEMGGDAPRILSLDDYFMTEVEKEVTDPETGRKVKTKALEYEYEAAVEPHYRGSLLKAFKKTISDGFFSFVIVDSINEKTKDYEEMWSFAKQKGFQVYVAEMDDDVTVCTKRNVHKRTEKEIQDLSSAWEKTPSHFIRLDVRSLLQAAAITEVEMEVVSDTEMEKVDEEEENEDENKKEDEEEDDQAVATFVKSRWDNVENSEQKLDRLDGLKRRREGFHTTMEDYLQLPDDVDQHFDTGAGGKKRVRWADLEERRQQEKMRAIGFVVGQTDWQRMTDPTFGESALTRTKYI